MINLLLFIVLFPIAVLIVLSVIDTILRVILYMFEEKK